MYTDRDLTCRDCGQTFVFTAGEQEFFASRGFVNDPSRCTTCRAERSSRNTSDSYNSGGYSSGGGYNGGGYRAERQMFPAVCSDCGKATQVPFQPRADRPVYCSECFEQHRPARTDSRSSARW